MHPSYTVVKPEFTGQYSMSAVYRVKTNLKADCMAVVVPTSRSSRPVVVVLELDGQHRLGEMSGPEVELLDPLLDGEGTEDEASGALDVESVVGGILWRTRLSCKDISRAGLDKTVVICFSCHYEDQY